MPSKRTRHSFQNLSQERKRYSRSCTWMRKHLRIEKMNSHMEVCNADRPIELAVFFRTRFSKGRKPRVAQALLGLPVSMKRTLQNILDLYFISEKGYSHHYIAYRISKYYRIRPEISCIAKFVKTMWNARFFKSLRLRLTMLS